MAAQRLLLGWLLAHWCVEGLAWYVGTHLLLVHTASLPSGLYWRLPRPAVLERGMLVEFTPPDWMVAHLPTLQPGEHVMKHVASHPGERVCWTEEGMRLRERVYLRPPRQPFREELRGCRPLVDTELIVTGDHAASFDSRAMGPLDQRRVVTRVVPVWTW
jgi:type IV secretory pathway protease TraF